MKKITTVLLLGMGLMVIWLHIRLLRLESQTRVGLHVERALVLVEAPSPERGLLAKSLGVFDESPTVEFKKPAFRKEVKKYGRAANNPSEVLKSTEGLGVG